MSKPYVKNLKNLKMWDIELVGGKNASLGEMIGNLSKLNIKVPGGFATTSYAFQDFLTQNSLGERIDDSLKNLDVESIENLSNTGNQIREWILETEISNKLRREIENEWSEITNGKEIAFAVRSSATAEDLPDASFAGQQETYLNIVGLDNLIDALHHVYASLYTDRAISYRIHHGFKHSDVSLSVGFQQMVKSDVGASGVMFTLDTESGFRDAIFITSSYGLGETVVQGSVNPDEFYVYKPAIKDGNYPILRKSLGDKSIKMVLGEGDSLGETVKIVDVDEEDTKKFSISEKDITKLAESALIIEKHYDRPMDIEWGKDGTDGEIYILQARPETVQSRSGNTVNRFTLKTKSTVLTSGRSIGQKIGSGTAKIISNVNEMHRIQSGDVLVSDMTDPDWEPVMKKASAIVTNRGGRTCHAAIIARELGIPAVVGCNNATENIIDNSAVTVSCAEGDEGYIYDGILDFEETHINVSSLPDIPVKIMMNVGNPDRAFSFSSIPNNGVGLARLEFIINRMIGIHPKALIEYDSMNKSLKAEIDEQMAGYHDPMSFFVDKLAEGVSTIAAAFAPKPVIVRMSDFKSNEYANLIGGENFEPNEENPMIGFRGAGRYVAENWRDCFDLECEAIKKVRNEMELKNVQLMIPFVRTVKQASEVIDLLAENELKRDGDLKIIMMSELPSNSILAEEFLEFFDGMSIGSNDMTQLTLGLDRDSSLVSDIFDERDQAVKKMLEMSIDACQKSGKYIGICGQGPSDYPDLAAWLVEKNIESMSLNPDTVIETWMAIAGKEL